MLYLCTNIIIVKGGVQLLPNAMKDAPQIAADVYFKSGIGEALRAFSIGITFLVVARLNATPERSKVDLDIYIPLDVILGADGFADIDSVTVCGVIVEHLGGYCNLNYTGYFDL